MRFLRAIEFRQAGTQFDYSTRHVISRIKKRKKRKEKKRRMFFFILRRSVRFSVFYIINRISLGHKRDRCIHFPNFPNSKRTSKHHSPILFCLILSDYDNSNNNRPQNNGIFLIHVRIFIG